MATMQESPALRRIVSIDALRGFDMFWIMGASSLVHGIQELAKSDKLQGIDPQRLELIAEQLTHVAWEGFHFWDLIFPLFVFLMGTSAVFSLTKVITQRGKVAAYRRVLFRSLALYVLGLIYYGGRGDPESFRYVGVLQRIAICYLFSGLLFIHFRFRGLLAISAVLLGGYWAAMTFIDVPEHGRGNFQEGMNLANYIDQTLSPRIQVGRRLGPRRPVEHLARYRHRTVGDASRAGHSKRKLGSMEEVVLSACVGRIVPGRWSFLGNALSDYQKALDFILCTPGRWLELPAVGRVLPGNRCLENSLLGPAICMDRDQLHYDLHAAEFRGRFLEPRVPRESCLDHRPRRDPSPDGGAN